MIKAEVFQRSEQPAKGYRAKTAADIFLSYSTVHTVEFWERGGSNRVAAVAQTGVACYVMSTGGKWGKSAARRPAAGELCERIHALVDVKCDAASHCRAFVLLQVIANVGEVTGGG